MAAAPQAPAPAQGTPSTPPLVVVSQNALPQTLSYLQGRGLQVQGVPPQERHVEQKYNELWERCAGAHGLLIFPGDTVDAQLLKHVGPQLVAVSVAGCRVESVDIAACTAAGVVVTATAAEVEAPYAAEHSVAQALSLLRELRVRDAEVRARGDEYVYTPPVRGRFSTGTVVGATIGLVGAGPLSAALAKTLVALGAAQVQCLSLPPGGRASDTSDVELVAAAVAPQALARPGTLPELLAVCDLVFLTCELTPRTKHLIDGAALATLKHGAVLVNASSGSLVDEAAVGAALHEGTKLGGYACCSLACDERRPGEGVPPQSHPDLISSPRALLGTGVCATAVLGAMQRVELEAARSLAEALTGRKPGGAKNDVAPRLPGAAPTSEVAKAGGLASYLWCF